MFKMFKKMALHAIIFVSVSMMFVSCQPSEKQGAEDAQKTDTVKKEVAPPAPTKAEAKTVKAQFVKFELGDASHFIFKDEKGAELDFGGCEEKNVQFEVELPAKEANETNQGFGSNKQLQNKWFMLTYEVRKQPLYQDGPEGNVMIITKAEEVK